MNSKADTLLAPSVLHEISEDLADTLLAQWELVIQWNSLTPIARNEWICWVTHVISNGYWFPSFSSTHILLSFIFFFDHLFPISSQKKKNKI